MGIWAKIKGLFKKEEVIVPACVDCKWHYHSGRRDRWGHMCSYPDKGLHTCERDVITGEMTEMPIHADKECSQQRIATGFVAREWNTCGKQGRWFEPKEEAPK